MNTHPPSTESPLLTPHARRHMPPLRTQDGLGYDAVAHLHVVSCTGWHHFLTEWDGEDICFGYVVGCPYPEWGYTSLREMAAVTVPVQLVVIGDSGERRFELPVPAFEADPIWRPVPVHEAIADWEAA